MTLEQWGIAACIALGLAVWTGIVWLVGRILTGTSPDENEPGESE